jgi:hypothetical protein
MSTVANPNVLRSDVDYIIQETANGVWRRYLYPNGRRFAEFKSYLNVGGLPLVHYTSGICPQTGRRVFKMSPLHHHFELSGWRETKVVVRFWIIAIMFALLSLATLKLR